MSVLLINLEIFSSFWRRDKIPCEMTLPLFFFWFSFKVFLFLLEHFSQFPKVVFFSSSQLLFYFFWHYSERCSQYSEFHHSPNVVGGAKQQVWHNHPNSHKSRSSDMCYTIKKEGFLKHTADKEFKIEDFVHLRVTKTWMFM